MKQPSKTSKLKSFDIQQNLFDLFIILKNFELKFNWCLS